MMSASPCKSMRTKLGPDKINIEFRMRDRLNRWELKLAPRFAASRSISLLKRLARLVAPKVWQVALKTLLNAWCTKRRFQEIGPCRFKCNPQARDSIEHYCRCPAVRQLHIGFLHVELPAGIQDFLLLPHPSWSDDRLTVCAVALFAVYTAFNWVRVNGSIDDLTNFLERSCYHAVLKNPRSSKALQAAINNLLC